MGMHHTYMLHLRYFQIKGGLMGTVPFLLVVRHNGKAIHETLSWTQVIHE